LEVPAPDGDSLLGSFQEVNLRTTRFSPNLLGIAFVCVLHARAALGQAQGPEFRVNAYTTFHEQNPRIASDSTGNFVVVWQTDTQDGSQDGVAGQRYANTGAPVGAEFRVNTYTTSLQRFPSVASDSGGNLVVVWDSFPQDGSSYGVFGQLYSSGGAPVGAEFRINTYTTSSQRRASVASDANGNFVVVWQSSFQDGYGYGVFGQRYKFSGLPLGAEFHVNTFTFTSQSFPSVASDSGGNFIVVWNGLTNDGSSVGVFGQRYGNAGALLGANFRVNGYTTNAQGSPSVASDPGGNFVVVWLSYDQDGSQYGVFGQRYGSTGAPSGAEFRVNTYTTGFQRAPSVASDSGGNFVVIWHGSEQAGAVDDIFGQRYGSAGAPLGAEFRVNTYTTDNQGIPSVASGPEGDFVVVWRSRSQDGSYYGVFGQRFCLALASVTIGVNGTTTVCANSTGGTATVTDVGGGLVTHQWAYRATSMTGMLVPLSGQTGPSYLVDGADFGTPPGTPGIYFLVCLTTPECGTFMISNEVPVTVNPADSTPPAVTAPSALTATQTLCT